MSNPSQPSPENSPSWLEIPASTIKPELASILTEIDKFTAGKLPRLGLLRFNARMAKVELVDLVKEHGDTSRKSFDNAKPFMDVLCAIASFLPQSAFEALTYREARELSAALTASKSDAVICAKVEKRLKACKFRKGWASDLAKLATPTASESAPDNIVPLPATESAPDNIVPLPAPASESAPAPDNIVALPDSGPMTPADLVAMVKEKLRAMPDKSREIARGMLARLVNEPAKLAELLAA